LLCWRNVTQTRYNIFVTRKSKSVTALRHRRSSACRNVFVTAIFMLYPQRLKPKPFITSSGLQQALVSQIQF